MIVTVGTKTFAVFGYVHAEQMRAPEHVDSDARIVVLYSARYLYRVGEVTEISSRSD